MALPTALAPEALTAAAVPDGMRLSTEVGWNQTAEDWALYIEHGRVIGLRDPVEGLIASAGIMPYPPDFGFLALVLVMPAWRHQGLATRLAEACLAMLRERHLIPALNATPAGAPAYERLGFSPVYGMMRWEGVAAGTDGALADGLRAADLADLPALIRLDAAGFGARRPFLIEALLRRPGTATLILEDGRGFAMARQGRIAGLIGPLVAPDETLALALLKATLAAIAGPVFLDLPERWTAIARWLEANGFRPQRSFLRMALGRPAPFGDPARMVLGAGPEFG